MTKEQRDELTAAETELRGALAEIARADRPARPDGARTHWYLRFAQLGSVSNTRPIASGKLKRPLFRYSTDCSSQDRVIPRLSGHHPRSVMTSPLDHR